MKVALTSIIFLVFFMKSIQSDENVEIEGVTISPEAVHITKNSSEYYEYIVKYGEMRDKEWFKPAVPTTKPGEKIRCAQWNEGYNVEDDFNVDYDVFKDCLILKIETSNLNASSPVMVYIPGFDLSSGDVDSTSGHYLLDKDIVLVTVQYRLGVLGFLSTNTEEIPGNVGASDIILALKWIKNNIAKFGGNPDLVTLFGQYKAAGLIGLLTMSPLAEDLFHQVIYQSGSPLISNLTTVDSYELARLIAKEINCTETDTSDLNKCLLNASYYNLLEAYRKIMEAEFGDVPLLDIEDINDIFPVASKSNSTRSYPTMAGFVSHPSILLWDYYHQKNNSALTSTLLKLVTKEISEDEDFAEKYDDSDDIELKKISMKMMITAIFAVFNDELREMIKTNLTDELDSMIAEQKLGLLAVLETIAVDEAPIYLYEFKYHGTEHYFPKKQGTWFKNYVTLLDDNNYLFKPEKVISEEDEEIAEIMTDLWSSFAHKEKPDSTRIPVYWPQFNDTNGPYLIIDQNVTIGTNYTIELAPLKNCVGDKDCEYFEDKLEIYTDDD